MSQTNLALQLINNLTDDEDDRQDLWVYLLEGNSLNSLTKRLEEIKKSQKIYDKTQKKLQDFFSTRPSLNFEKFLTHFSEFEKSIMFFMVIGYSVDEISRYKDTSVVRVMQTIATIKENSAWMTLREKHGT